MYRERILTPIVSCTLELTEGTRLLLLVIVDAMDARSVSICHFQIRHKNNIG